MKDVSKEIETRERAKQNVEQQRNEAQSNVRNATKQFEQVDKNFKNVDKRSRENHGRYDRAANDLLQVKSAKSSTSQKLIEKQRYIDGRTAKINHNSYSIASTRTNILAYRDRQQISQGNVQQTHNFLPQTQRQPSRNNI